MGCKLSKLDNKDMVQRRKERLRLMKETVHARHYLAVAMPTTSAPSASAAPPYPPSPSSSPFSVYD
ncbi:hypothetical protein TIFTF001_007542 [Ficus carica]|uniref:DUF630 domain-containing protein n=1 Tax=Ficus carica TaxID=3494 RepID=A0AA88A365_FICCA|nr:hypothetical protein TIFTF001_007542 [Ficus carica]